MQDTHYLLYIGDRMQNELLERTKSQKETTSGVTRDLTMLTLDSSRRLSKKMYEKPSASPTAHLDLLSKHSLFFNDAQINGFFFLGKSEEEKRRKGRKGRKGRKRKRKKTKN